MKRIFNNGFVLIAGLLSSSLMFQACEDMLDKKPVSRLTKEDLGPSVISTAEQAESFLTSNYADFRSLYFLIDFLTASDGQSDNAYAGGTNPSTFEIDEYRIATTNANIKRDWEGLYTAISKSNRILDNIDNITDTLLTEQRRMEIKGEASFIRAFMYFELMKYYGAVPMLLEYLEEFDPENFDGIFLPRASEGELITQMLADLEVARVNVRQDKEATRMIITKDIVHALTAKVYAAMEVPNWTKVNAHCDSVIASGYLLMGSYDDLWTAATDNSDESIFKIPFSGGFFLSGTTSKKNVTPSNDLVATFDDEGDAIRKASAIKWVNGTGKWTDLYWPVDNFPQVNKYRTGNSIFILYRLADIMLLKAEALNELNDLSGAAGLVDLVRDRVGLLPTTAATKADMRLAIEKERRLELAFEGHRWHDLKRTGRAVEVMQAVKDGNNVNLGYNINGNRLVWPIPQVEIDRNVKLAQNPGY